MKILFLVSFCFLVCACESMMFGMPESQFKSLSAPQQQQVIDAYNQRQMVEKQNEPLNNLVHAASNAVMANQH